MAQDDTLVAKVPFAFRVGNVTLPSGKYTLKEIGSSEHWMEIRSARTGRGAFFQVALTDVRKAPSKDELVFNRVGNHYALRTVLDQGNDIGSTVIRFRRG